MPRSHLLYLLGVGLLLSLLPNSLLAQESSTKVIKACGQEFIHIVIDICGQDRPPGAEAPGEPLLTASLPSDTDFSSAMKEPETLVLMPEFANPPEERTSNEEFQEMIEMRANEGTDVVI